MNPQELLKRLEEVYATKRWPLLLELIENLKKELANADQND